VRAAVPESNSRAPFDSISRGRIVGGHPATCLPSVRLEGETRTKVSSPCHIWHGRPIPSPFASFRSTPPN